MSDITDQLATAAAQALAPGDTGTEGMYIMVNDEIERLRKIEATARACRNHTPALPQKGLELSNWEQHSKKPWATGHICQWQTPPNTPNEINTLTFCIHRARDRASPTGKILHKGSPAFARVAVFGG
jgi:hypothetical protein